MPIIERAVEIAQSQETVEHRQPAPTVVAESSSSAVHERPRQPPAPQRPELQVRTDTSPTALDLKPIVHIDFDRLRAAGRMPTAEAARRTEDEMRRIKWPLLGAIASRPGHESVRNNVILVTSAMPGEGKTYTALNLALSIVRDR